jgi:NitT/TauT family transport system substrate-binding protein
MKALRRSLLASIAATALLLATGAPSRAEDSHVDIAVGGKPLLYYLPLTLAEQLGYFKDEGLDVTISDFQGGSKSLQALVGGSADVVTGAYDHTIQMQAKGQPIVAVIDLGRFPGIVLAVRKEKAADYKGPESLKGMKVGVTAPGSSTNFAVNYFLTQHGLKPEDVSFIGVGGGPSAVAAIKRGEVDALANLDPVISQLEQSGEIEVIADSRTAEGAQKLYGGGYPAAVLYTTQGYIEANPETVQKLVNAFARTLRWMQTSSVEEIVAKVPPEYLAGDAALYRTALERSLPMYSPDGQLDMQAAKNALNVLSAFDPAVKSASIDLAATWDGRFIKSASQ